MPEQAQNELEKVRADALALGRKLGLLLAAAQMPAEQKEAWAALIPEMNAQQMADLADALERRITDVEEQAFSALATRLQEAQAKYGGRVVAATDEAHKALTDLEDEMKPPAV